jgi:hypothetical protein
MNERQIIGLLEDFFAGKKVPVLSPSEAIIEEEVEKDDDED